MKKNKKLFVLAALFLAVFAVGGTLAYLTDTSETKTNTFTFGNVDITLTEPTWEPNGTGITAAADMVPGKTVDKDPTVTVTSNSKNAYVFVKVTIPTGAAGGVPNSELFTVGALGTGWIDATADILGANAPAGTYIYAYGTSSAMTSVPKNTTLPAVFSVITANSDLTGNELSALNNTADVVVNAYAIQAEGLGAHTSPAQVWGDFGFTNN